MERLRNLAGSRLRDREGPCVDFLFMQCSHGWGELSFKVVKLENSGQEPLALAGDFMIARAAFDTAVSLWPKVRLSYARAHG
jgi:hypothetical protein